ncbi:hypothetical protein QF023_003486 [Chryseobacterium sp. SLBN-27]|nr:hypothetical protein [Chryseobacterium sp. SLBN-27]
MKIHHPKPILQFCNLEELITKIKTMDAISITIIEAVYKFSVS